MLWRFCLVLFVGVLLEWQLTQSAPAEVGKPKEKVRAYEFGFSIEEQQHRHEKRDENGIVMGEFGFITADGIYHVTVYATDENGKFKIVSMKNFPYGNPEKKIMIATIPMVKKPVVMPPVVKALIPDGSSCGGCVLPKKTRNPLPASVGEKKPIEQKAVFKPLSKDLNDSSAPGGGGGVLSTKGTGQSKTVSTPLAGNKDKSGSQSTPKSPGSQPLVPPKLPSSSGTQIGGGTVGSKNIPDINVRFDDEDDKKSPASGKTKGNGKQAQGTIPKTSVPISPSIYNSIPLKSKNVLGSVGSKIENPLDTQNIRPIDATAYNTKTSNSFNTKKRPVLTAPGLPAQPTSTNTDKTKSTKFFTNPINTKSTVATHSHTKTSDTLVTQNVIQDLSSSGATISPFTTPNILTQPKGTTDFNTKTKITSPGLNDSNKKIQPTTFNPNNAPQQSGLPAYNTNTIPKEQPQRGERVLPNTFTQNTASKSIQNTKESKSNQQPTKNQSHEGSLSTLSLSSSTPSIPTRNNNAPFTRNTIKPLPGQQSTLVTPSPKQITNNAFTQPQLNTNSPASKQQTNTYEAKTQTPSSSSSKNLPPSAPSSKSTGKSVPSTNGGSSGGSGGSGGVGSGASVGGPLYRFKYVLDYNSHREEGRTDGSKEGKYNTIHEDGIRRIIDYIANENGYQPHIKLERPPPNELPSGENKLKEYEFVWFY